jgi:hypothetical protein
MTGKPRASELWYNVLHECRELGIDAVDVLAIQHSSGQSLAGMVMTSKDWDSCGALHGALADGVYLSGCLIRTSNEILYKIDEDGRSIGLQFLPAGARYGGEFLHEVRHGQGFLDFNTGVIYEGEFRDGKMTGWGKSTMLEPKKSVFEGIFAEGEFLGNPRIGHQQTAGGRNFFNQCRRLMGMRS